MYKEFPQSSAWSIYGSVIDTTTPCQNWPGSNDKEKVLHTPQSHRDPQVKFITQDIYFFGGDESYPSLEDTVSIF